MSRLKPFEEFDEKPVTSAEQSSPKVFGIKTDILP